MDRSFLSDASVVEASRQFVCIRLATYEDAAEAEFMKSVYVGRSGQLENTTFAILTPNGRTKLTAAGRGPFHAFRGSRSMADGMRKIAAKYPQAAKHALTDTELPFMKSLDIALNVAAADGLPMLIVRGDTPAERAGLCQRLVPAAWSEALAGQFVYCFVTRPEELKPVRGVEQGSRIVAVDPGPFGLSGKVLAQFTGDESTAQLKHGLLQAVADMPRSEKGHDNHVQLGIQLGIEWESEIPETDVQSLQAKERVRGRQSR